LQQRKPDASPPHGVPSPLFLQTPPWHVWQSSGQAVQKLPQPSPSPHCLPAQLGVQHACWRQNAGVWQMAQFAPPAPQAPSLVPRWQDPAASQQPSGQLRASQTQAPLTQRCPEAHAFSQAPQWSLSVWRLAHPSGQKTVFGGQAAQALFRHCPLQHSDGLPQPTPSPLQEQRAFPSDPAAPKRLQHLSQDGG
jgi:hypothetical protein